jgi:tRNA (guanine37-N1)-methyltransferase
VGGEFPVKVALLTLFPRFFDGPLDEGMIRIGRLDIDLLDLRNFTDDVHRTTDDTMYGGGAGMVMKCDPIVRALETVPDECRERVILTSPRGRRFDETMARELSGRAGFSIVCGRYKGVDERVIALTGAVEVSIGDYVLSGGEPAALVLLDAAVRHVPGVLGDYDSAVEDSFYDGLLGYPVYTRPEEFRGEKVPEVLLSGHHARIAAWRREQMLKTTWERRPDLLAGVSLKPADRKFLARLESGASQAKTGPRKPGGKEGSSEPSADD